MSRVEASTDRLVLAGPDPEALLEEVRRRLGPDAEVLSAERTLKGGIAGFFAREWFTVTAVPAGVGEGDPAESDRGEPAPASTAADAAHTSATTDTPDTPAADERLDPADEEPSVLEIAAGLVAGVQPTAPSARGFADVLAAALAAADAGDAPVRRAAPRRLPSASAPIEAAPTPPTPAVAPAAVPAARPRIAVAALLDRLERRLRPVVELPDRGVVVVVGEAEAALGTARSLAVAHGIDPDGVMMVCPEERSEVSAWMQVHSPSAVASRAARWSARPHTVILAVVLEPGLEGARWCAEVIEASAAEQVRLVAHGWRAPAEFAPRIAALGRVDAIDLVEVDEADDPAAFLDLVPPVATLDGRPASASLWAAYLVAHVSTAPVDARGGVHRSPSMEDRSADHVSHLGGAR